MTKLIEYVSVGNWNADIIVDQEEYIDRDDNPVRTIKKLIDAINHLHAEIQELKKCQN
jgi:Na+/phosphate symporter